MGIRVLTLCCTPPTGLDDELAGPPAGPGGHSNIFDEDGHGLFGDSRNPAKLLEPEVVIDGLFFAHLLCKLHAIMQICMACRVGEGPRSRAQKKGAGA